MNSVLQTDKWLEIVLVLTQFEDNTENIIKEYQKDNPKIKLFKFPWTKSFAEARNFATVKTDWEKNREIRALMVFLCFYPLDFQL